MLNNAKKAISLVMLLIGLAVVARSVMATGSFKPTAGLVAGIAFTVYGAARLYYFRGTP